MNMTRENSGEHTLHLVQNGDSVFKFRTLGGRIELDNPKHMEVLTAQCHSATFYRHDINLAKCFFCYDYIKPMRHR